MTDPYRISDAPEADATSVRRGALRPVLWLVLFVSGLANAICSTAGINPFVGAGFGVITLASAVALIVHHYRHRRNDSA
jgi:hypothetical protein